jgi:hypothetical protein
VTAFLFSTKAAFAAGCPAVILLRKLTKLLAVFGSKTFPKRLKSAKFEKD